MGREEGFSLIEVVIAMFILTVALLAMITMQTKAVTTNFQASTTTKASVAAAGQLERLQGLSYGDSELDAGNHTLAAAPGTDFPVSWVVTLNSPVNGCKRIKLTVAIPNSDRSVTYEYVKNKDF